MPKYTPEQQAAIDKALKEQQERAKQAELDAMIRNAILDEQRKKPGYTGY